MKRLAAALFLFWWLAPAAAEDLVTALSTHKVEVTSNFAGTTITVFGTVERDVATVARPGSYDIVVSVRGPVETITTRRKERVLGLWLNYGVERLVNVPSFYAAFSNRPIARITGPRQRKALQIGFDGLVLPVTAETLRRTLQDYEIYTEAFLRLKGAQGLYSENPRGVEFLSPSLFRATIPLPANAPIGDYRVEIHLFADSSLLRSQEQSLNIAKAGFEHAIVTLSGNRPVLYAMITLMLAFMVGWLANFLFRSD